MEIKKITFALFVVVLTACASNKSVDTSTSAKLNIDKPVYALLKKTKSGYRFTEFQSHKPASNSLPWVNLKTGMPTWATRTSRCGVGLIKSRNHNVYDCDEVVKEELFLESDFDEGDAAIRVLGAAFTMGLTLTGASFDVVFNNDAWEEAYKEAYSNTDISTLENFGVKLAELNVTYKSTVKNYSNAKIQAKDNIKFNYIDKSGLYYSQTDFKNLVSYKARNLAHIPNYYGSSAVELMRDFDNKKQVLVSEWDTLSSSILVNCSSHETNGFTVEMVCPDYFKVINGKVVGEITVNILNRNFNRVFVKNYNTGDDNLRLIFDDELIGLSNNTDKFLSIDSIAVYYLDNVAKNKNLDIELSPRSQLMPDDKLKLRTFLIKWNSLTYNNMTKSKAKETDFKFGFAIKYRIIDSGVEKTIFSTDTFKLIDLIASK